MTRKSTENRNPITPMRLDPETLAMIQHLAGRWGSSSLTAVVRQAVRVTARLEGYSIAEKPGKKNPK